MATADISAIVTRGLTKNYGGGRGVTDLGLEVGVGEVFGFLGPNGAGKTTTIRLLMGMIRPTSGSAQVFGLDCQRDAVAVKHRVGYVPGELPDWGQLRGSEITASMAALRGGVDPAHVAWLCQELELDLGRRWRELSRGNKQKLALVLALMHRPALLVLDEPTTHHGLPAQPRHRRAQQRGPINLAAALRTTPATPPDPSHLDEPDITTERRRPARTPDPVDQQPGSRHQHDSPRQGM